VESNSNPDGTVKVIVPDFIWALELSEITGPVKVVYSPFTVSAEIVEPPVAEVIDAAANALGAEAPRMKMPRRTGTEIRKSLFIGNKVTSNA